MTKAKTNTSIRLCLALALSPLLLSACGLEESPEATFDGDSGVAAESEPVELIEPVQSELTISPNIVPQKVQDIAKKASDIAGVISKGHEAISTGLAILRTLNILPTPPSEFELIIAEINRVGGALDWKVTALERNNQWAALSGALNVVAGTNVAAGQRIPQNSFDDSNSRNAAKAAGGLVMFQRLYKPDAIKGDWKKIITDHKPEIMDDQQVFDWRIGLPWFLQAIAMRLQVIAAVDPSFQRSGNATIRSELTDLRNLLLDAERRMLAGIRCGTSWGWAANTTPPGPWGSYGGPPVYVSTVTTVCADINTGLSVTDYVNVTVPESCYGNWTGWQKTWSVSCMQAADTTGSVWASEQRVRGTLVQTMPSFATRTVIDDLARFAHGGADPTQVSGSIRSMHDQNLCLDIQMGNLNRGTPVWLWPCTGNFAQHWVYDRSTRTIRNPPSGRCLDVQWGNPGTGIPIWIWDCIGTPAQRWSYDPVSGVFQNELGTTLDIQWGVVAQGTPLWAWPRHEGHAQRWF